MLRLSRVSESLPTRNPLWGGDKLNPLYVGIDVSSKSNVAYMNEEELEKCKTEQRRCFGDVCRNAENYDLIVLDEIFGAISTGMVGANEIAQFVSDKPERTELVLTGRGAPDGLIELADNVSEIQCVKHPYGKGVQDRPGIEF